MVVVRRALGGFLLLASAACVSVEVDPRAGAAPKVPPQYGDDAPLWTTPVYFRQVTFLFEVDADDELIAPEPSEYRLHHGDREVLYTRAAFLIQGYRYDFPPGTRVWVYHRPEAGERWFAIRPDLQVGWYGDGRTFPLEMRWPDGKFGWHVAGHAIEYDPIEGTVLVRGPRGRERFQAPGRLFVTSSRVQFAAEAP